MITHGMHVTKGIFWHLPYLLHLSRFFSFQKSCRLKMHTGKKNESSVALKKLINYPKLIIYHIVRYKILLKDKKYRLSYIVCSMQFFYGMVKNSSAITKVPCLTSIIVN